MLVQERSPRVLNAVGKLAVIPKAFHQPTVEPAAEAHLSTSLLRELEEELLGREELGNLFSSDFRNVDPFHTDLLSGNYEFACLVVIDDEEWWGTVRRPAPGELGGRAHPPVLLPRYC